MLQFRQILERLDLAVRPLERLLFRSKDEDDRAAAGERPQAAWSLQLTRLMAMVAGLIFVGGFLYFVVYYQSTKQRMLAEANVRDLTKEGFVGRIQFGPSPLCGQDRHPCWTEPQFNDGGWTSVLLPLDPSNGIRAMPNYAVGQRTNSLYYRMQVPISPRLAAIPSEISFSPMSIQHSFYEVFLDGREVYSSNGRLVLGQMLNLPIPRDSIHNGFATVVIHASVQPEDIGLAHYGQVMVGPKSALDGVYVLQERTFYTYYLLFLLSKGSVFVVFALFLIYTRGQRGMRHFLVYAFFTTVENLFVGEFFSDSLSLNWRALAFHGSKTMSSIGLWGFFIAYFQMRRARRWYVPCAVAALTLTCAFCFDFGWGSHHISFGAMRLLNRIYLIAILAFALGVGNISRHMWRRHDTTSERYRSLRSFCWLLGGFLAFDIWEYFVADFGGFDVSAVLDLFLFYFIALISARDFGMKEGQIDTLESHMEEKHRMELELQSAAEIAKAFLPDHVPTWTPFEIDVFHRPLTENSGDWFAFERSGNGKFFHFIMCDITGHGVQAAIVVSTCKTMLSSFQLTNPASLDRDDFIVQFAVALNATLFQNGHGSHVSTLLGLSFEPEAQKLHYFSAGHPLPLHLAKASGATAPRALVARHNLLGISPEYQGAMRQVAFVQGDELITYTDGLPAASHIKVLKTFLGTQKAPELHNRGVNLYQTIWAAETAKTTMTPNDDVSIVWFRAA